MRSIGYNGRGFAPSKDGQEIKKIYADAKKNNPHSAMRTDFVSLFSGGMGLDIGLERAGFHSVLCNEIDRMAVETIKINRPKVPVLDFSIEEVSGEKILEITGFKKGEIPLIAGGPPCQSFSVYGNRKGVHDGRGKMIFEFLRLVDELRPHAFIMENVRGLHSMPIFPEALSEIPSDAEPWMTQKGSLLKEVFISFEKIGYRIDGFLVNSVNYGAPQIRERLILVGNRHNVVADFPKPTNSNRPNDDLPPFRTLRDVIGNGFVDPDESIMNFSPRKLKYLAMVPPGGNWRSLPVDLQKESMGKSWFLKGGRSATWRRLSWDFPSPTVVTMPNHASTSMCHPDEVRALTVGECAAIQEFPRSWVFSGKTSDKYKQIGNAVPPKLGEMAGKCVLDIFRKIEAGASSNKVVPSRIEHLRPHVRTKRYWHKGQALAGDHDYYLEDGSEEPISDQLLLI